MQLRFTQTLAALRQALGFLNAHLAVLGSVNSGGGRRALDEVTSQLASRAEEQDSHRIQGTGALHTEKQLARALRRKRMWPIVKVARAKLPELAQLEAVRMPALRSNNTDLATRAVAMADAVQSHAAELHDGGLPADFLDRLRAAAAELVQTIASKGSHTGTRISATDGIKKIVKQARRAVNVVDSLVRSELGETDPLLADWSNLVRAVRKSAARAIRPAAGDSAPPPAPATTAGASEDAPSGTIIPIKAATEKPAKNAA